MTTSDQEFVLLMSLLAPEAFAGTSPDWIGCEREFRVSFPPDYKLLTSELGCGVVDEDTYLTFPATECRDDFDRTLAYLRLMRKDSLDFPQGEAVWPEQGGLFPFGAVGVGANLCWRKGESRDWPIIVESSGTIWDSRSSLVRFLTGILTGAVSCSLFGGWPFWGEVEDSRTKAFSFRPI